MNPLQNKTITNKHESPTKQNKKQINMNPLQNKTKTNKHESPTKQNKNK
jgi:hypothetical protein